MAPDRFNSLMTLLGSAIGKGFSPEERLGWYGLLSNVRDEYLEAALTRAANECKGFCDVRTIRDFASEAEHGIPSPAADAWQQVLHAVHRFSTYEPRKAEEFLGPVLWRAICCGEGYQHLCSMERSERVGSYAQFLAKYASLTAIEHRERSLPEGLSPKITSQVYKAIPAAPKATQPYEPPPPPTAEAIAAARKAHEERMAKRRRPVQTVEQTQQIKSDSIAALQAMIANRERAKAGEVGCQTSP